MLVYEIPWYQCRYKYGVQYNFPDRTFVALIPWDSETEARSTYIALIIAFFFLHGKKSQYQSLISHLIMRLFTLLVFLFGIVHTSAYSIPGGYERVLFYYLYSIDCQLNGGTPKQIATGCKGTGKNPCTLDQLLRYISDNPNSLPTRAAPATSYPALPDMDQTAQALTAKGTDGKDFAGPIQTTHVLEGGSHDYSNFLSQIGFETSNFAYRSPEHANLLKHNLQAIRNTRRMAQLTSFKMKYPGINAVSTPTPLYDGAPNNLNVDLLNPATTMGPMSKSDRKDFISKWEEVTRGNHAENVKQLGSALKNMEYACE